MIDDNRLHNLRTYTKDEFADIVRLEFEAAMNFYANDLYHHAATHAGMVVDMLRDRAWMKTDELCGINTKDHYRPMPRVTKRRIAEDRKTEARRWTEDEDKILLEAKQAGLTYAEIVPKLVNRSQGSTEHRYLRLKAKGKIND